MKAWIEGNCKVDNCEKDVKLTKSQIAFLEFLEKNRGKNFFVLRSRSGGMLYVQKLIKNKQ